jgi:hypothetical protein
MSIGDQFAGLDMKALIGGPLSAAAEASINLAQGTASFINKVGFNEDKSARTVLFKFEKSDNDPLGNPLKSEMRMEVPLLAIVPIPNLQIDEVNILFDMEVRQCEKSDSSTDGGGSFSGGANFGIAKMSVSGSVATHSSNTRSSDNSAKYHVDVSAANHGMPEGLARVLDIMAAATSPTLLSSKMVDKDGKEVDSVIQEKRANLQLSYTEQQKLGSVCKAALDQYEASLQQLKALLASRGNAEKQKIQQALNAPGIDDPKRATYTEFLHELNNSWEQVSSEVRPSIEGLCPPVADEAIAPATDDPSKGLADLFDIKKITGTDSLTLDKIASADIATINTSFATAFKNYAAFKFHEQSLTKERSKYNTLLMTK